MYIDDLQERLKVLYTDAERIKSEGGYLQGVRLERYVPGGTASIGAKEGALKYARLRAGKGRLLSNGKKSQSVPLGQIAKVERAIARGKALAKVEKQIAKLEGQLRQLVIRQTARQQQGFAFGQQIRFIHAWGNHDLVVDGVVLAVTDESVEVAYRLYMPGKGEQTGVMTVAIADLKLI